MKICPYCGENVANNAKKCRFCGEFLEEKNIEMEENLQNEENLFDSKEQKKKIKNITCGKRFGKYILYLLRDWFIFLVVDGITQGFGIWKYNTYADSHFAFDMFICFIIFIIETVRLISDCSKIKKMNIW